MNKNLFTRMNQKVLKSWVIMARVRHKKKRHFILYSYDNTKEKGGLITGKWTSPLHRISPFTQVHQCIQMPQRIFKLKKDIEDYMLEMSITEMLFDFKYSAIWWHTTGQTQRSESSRRFSDSSLMADWERAGNLLSSTYVCVMCISHWSFPRYLPLQKYE